MTQMGVYRAGPVSAMPRRPGDGLSDTLPLHGAARFLYPCLVDTGRGGEPFAFGSQGIQSNFFCARQIRREPRLSLELCGLADGHTQLLRRGVAQNGYSSLLATNRLFERLGNRQASRAQAPQEGCAITVPAPEKEKKGRAITAH